MVRCLRPNRLFVPALAFLLCGFIGLERLAIPEAKLIDPFWARHDPARGARVDHYAWDRFLAKYVKTDARGLNRVAYADVSPADRAALDDYLRRLYAIPSQELARPEQLAYWVNLYNARTVALVLDHYPVESIRDIKFGLFSFGPWSEPIMEVQGRRLSLNDVEHGIIRPIWRDPRIHYVITAGPSAAPSSARPHIPGIRSRRRRTPRRANTSTIRAASAWIEDASPSRRSTAGSRRILGDLRRVCLRTCGATRRRPWQPGWSDTAGSTTTRLRLVAERRRQSAARSGKRREPLIAPAQIAARDVQSSPPRRGRGIICRSRRDGAVRAPGAFFGVRQGTSCIRAFISEERRTAAIALQPGVLHLERWARATGVRPRHGAHGIARPQPRMIRIGMLRTLVPLALLVMVGCAGPRALERDLAGEPLVAICLESYRLIDDAVAKAGVRDAEAHRVPGFPYLRVNRFLASFSEQDLSPAPLEAWVDRLVQLDREGRTVELKNLSDSSRARLDHAIAAALGTDWRALDVLEQCPPISAAARPHANGSPGGAARTGQGAGRLLTRQAHARSIPAHRDSGRPGLAAMAGGAPAAISQTHG